MDPSVTAALAKWPHVPAAYGWLALSAQGEWLLKGSPITSPQLCGFIHRNYAVDTSTGEQRWYFQNGPQRVFVTLEAAPWVLFAAADGSLNTHTGQAFGVVTAAYLDEADRLYFSSALGLGVVAGRELTGLSERLQSAADGPLTWHDPALPQPLVIALVNAAALLAAQGIVATPVPLAGEPVC